MEYRSGIPAELTYQRNSAMGCFRHHEGIHCVMECVPSSSNHGVPWL